ncbi:MAG: helix-turn-helix domain-containing protein, partial [bacterium]
MTEKITLADLITEFRTTIDMKQNEVAQQADVAAPSLSFYENGERTPPYKTLIKLLDFFDAQLTIETDLDKWIFKKDKGKEITLEKQPKSKE